MEASWNFNMAAILGQIQDGRQLILFSPYLIRLICDNHKLDVSFGGFEGTESVDDGFKLIYGF